MSDQRAGLEIYMESSTVETADKRMASATTSAQKLERATDALNDNAKRTATATGQMAEQMRRLDDVERQAYNQAIQLARATRDLAASQEVAAVATGRGGLAIAGMAARAIGAVTGFTLMGAAMAAASFVAEKLTEKVTAGARANEELAEKAARLRSEVEKTAPALNAHGASSDLATSAIQVFDAWVVKNTQSLVDQANAAKTAAVNVFQAQAAQAAQQAADLRDKNTRQTARGTVFTGGAFLGIGGISYEEYRRRQADADQLVAETQGKVKAALDAGSEAFVRQEKAAASHTRALHEQKLAVDPLIEAFKELAKAAKLGQDAAREYAAAGRVDIAGPEAAQNASAAKAKADFDEEGRRRGIEMLREQERLAKSYSERVRIGRDIEAAERENDLATRGWTARLIQSKAEADREDIAAGYHDLYDGLTNAADALKDGDWASAVTSVMDAFAVLRNASASAANKIGSAAGLANFAGQQIGGVAGSTISGAASGATTGAAIGSVLLPGIGTAVGAFIGGALGFLSGSKKKDEERQRQREAEAQRVQAIADQHRQLEIALMEQSGDAVGALAARRADELKGLDASNRALAESLYAAQDAAAAAAKAEEEAAKAADMAKTRRGLEIDLIEAQGGALQALAMRRADELDAMDASLRSIQSAIWAAQDLRAANDNLASSLATLADLQAQAAMEAQQAQVSALQAAAQAAQEVLDAANTRLDAARSTLSAAYDREAGALKGVVDGMSAFAKTVHDFRTQLANDATGSSYGASKSAFYTAAAAGPSGDASVLVGAAQAFREQSRSNARTLLDFQRDQAGIDSALALAEAAAGAQVDVGQAQLDALNKSVGATLTVNGSILSLHDALAAFAAATAAQAIALSASNGATGNAQQAAAALQAQQAAQAAQQRADAIAKAQNDANAAAGAGAVNWASYLTHYKDVAGAYSSDPNAQAAGRSMEEWAKFHYDAVGKNEGRTPYAMGGAFSGAVGDILSQETHVGAGRVGGEAGPEAIMPLERGPDGKLGVRAGGNDNSDVVDALRTIQGQLAASQAETRQLRVQLVALKDEVAKVTANTGKAAIDTANINKTLTNVTHGGEAMQVQDAA